MSLAAAIISLIAEGISELAPVLAGLLAGTMSADQALAAMKASVAKMQTALSPGGLMDQILAKQKQDFDTQLDNLGKPAEAPDLKK